MCDRPILIKNPYRGLQNIGINRFKDCTSAFIPVPCGNCPTCISLRQSYFVSRCQMESLDNHLFMITLTYKNSMIRSREVNGYKLKYADYTDVQNMLKRLRKKGFKFKALFVSEYGGRNHRPHFHGIISVNKNPKDTYLDILNLEWKLSNAFLSEWCRNVGSRKYPVYVPLCDYISNHKGRTYDFHYINPACTPDGESDVAFYVTKYILKSDKWLDSLKSALKLNTSPDDFKEIWQLLKPKCCISKHYGVGKSVSSHIRKGINAALNSQSPYPYYINPVTGNTFPLSPYYCKRFITYDDAEKFYSFRGSETLDNILDSISDPKKNVKSFEQKFSKVLSKVQSKFNSYDFMFDDEKMDDFSEFLPQDQLEEIVGYTPTGSINWSEFAQDF